MPYLTFSDVVNAVNEVFVLLDCFGVSRLFFKHAPATTQTQTHVELGCFDSELVFDFSEERAHPFDKEEQIEAQNENEKYPLHPVAQLN